MKIRDLAEQAIKLNKLVSLKYRGENRLVEIHAVGRSSKGKPCMRVYQVVAGAEFANDGDGWRMLSLENVEDMKILDMATNAPRPGYKPGDTGMGTIYMEISNEPVPIEASS